MNLMRYCPGGTVPLTTGCKIRFREASHHVRECSLSQCMGTAAAERRSHPAGTAVHATRLVEVFRVSCFGAAEFPDIVITRARRGDRDHRRPYAGARALHP